MLKVIGSKEPSSATVEFGEYVPLTVEFNDERLPAAPFYWRIGNFVNSLVEIGINRQSGAVAKIGLVAYSESDLLSKSFDFLNVRCTAGLPVIDTDGWPNDRYKDEVDFFTVAENVSCVLLCFSPDRVASIVYSSDGVRFGVNINNDLIWIAVQKDGSEG